MNRVRWTVVVMLVGRWTTGGYGSSLDVIVKELPVNMQGTWCEVDHNEMKRCGGDFAVSIKGTSYVEDTLCVIKRIDMAPDKTYFVDADCLAEGGSKVISHAKVSAHLAGEVLHWDEKEELVEEDK